MSTPAQKANLARIRDNQRRSRARRKEYLQELEQRLRACELQGIEASAEVQVAARRVAEENKQLRELLNRYGFSDEYIANYLQSGATATPDSAQTSFRANDPASTVQSLQQLLVPRRPAGLDQGIVFQLPSQSSRETSSASASTASSSLWDPAHTTMAAYGHHPQPMAAPPPVMATPNQEPYTSPAFGNAIPARQDPFASQQHQAMLSDPRQGIVTTQPAQPMPLDTRPAMNYQYSMPPYNDPTTRNYGPPGGSC
ncbi:kyphoscoliosis peptidase [Purpureocillium lavendulum]|uniref:Kyphoscoliosis peptidase n=1 Tax=Purpureocillium lavendulum TaxID=1247861 RepID=A0AB34FZU3_9HYPO|nr:kyphoscoliosis peptidase [Purpureocillium lavendulum]